MRNVSLVIGAAAAIIGSAGGAHAQTVSQMQQGAFDQNLLANPGFETNDANRFGNNIRNSVDGWFVGGGARPNIVRVDGAGGFNYANSAGRPFGPQNDAQNNGAGAGAGVNQHYLDIVGGTNSVFQTFSTPTCDAAPLAPITWTVSGYISGRDQRTSGFGELRIRQGFDLDAPLILSDAGSSPRVEINSASQTDTWSMVSAEYTLEQGTDYVFEAFLEDNANFDEGSVVQNGFVCPDVETLKNAPVVTDTNGSGVFGDVGDIVTYEFFVENTGTTSLAGIAITDTGPEGGTGAFTLTQPAPGFDGDLAPGEGPTLVATATYVLTLQDVLSGNLSNEASFSAQPVETDGNGNPVPGAPLPGFPLFVDETDPGTGNEISQVDGTTTPIPSPANTDSDGVPGNDDNEPNLLTLPPLMPNLTLVKAADTSDFSSPVAVGDEISFTFTVTNTGNIDLDQAGTVPTDSMQYGSDGSGGPVATPLAITRAAFSSDNNDGILQPGEVITYQGTFVLDQLAIDSGGVSNTASVEGTAVDPAGNPLVGVPPVTATSDNDAGEDGVDGTVDGNGNNPTVVGIANTAALSTIKSATAAFSDPPVAGDIVTFTYVVTNTGNVTVFNVGVAESAATFSGTGSVPSPVLQSGGSNEDQGVGTLDLLPDQTMIFSADYSVTAEDIAAGVLENTAEASGTDLDGNIVADTSDAGSDPAGDPVNNPEGVETTDVDGNTDGDATNDPTVFEIQSPPVAQDDTISAPTPGVSATVPLVTGNDTDVDGTVQPDRVSLVAPAGANTLVDADGDIVSVAVSGEGTWTVDQAGNVTFTPEAGFEGNPTPIGYTVLDDDGLPSNIAEVSVEYDQLPAIAVEKSADTTALQTPPQVGDEITYTYVVTNTGNVTLFDVTVAETAGDFTGNGTLPAPVFQTGGANIDGESDGNDLAVGSGTMTFTATYELVQEDIDQGGVVNSAAATGDNVTGVPATDFSDDPTDPTNVLDDGNPADVTAVTLQQVSTLSLIKSVANADNANGDGVTGGVDDNITFVFTVTNTGNTTLTDIAVSDPLVTVSPAATTITLAPGEGDNITFTGIRQVTAADVAATVFENTATVNGLDPNNNPVSDVSDAGSDRDGNLVPSPEGTETVDAAGNIDGLANNDPTVIRIPVDALPRLSVIKSVAGIADTNANGLIDAGDVVTYSFNVTNVGNVRLDDVVVEDAVIGFTSAPFDLGIPGQSPPAIIETVIATYALTDADVAAGVLENTATATGNAVDGLGNPLLDGNGVQITGFDISDAGTEPELDSNGAPIAIANPEGNETPDNTAGPNGDPTDDPTVLSIPSPGIEVIKTVADVFDTNSDGVAGGVGDTVTFAFEITNTGNVDLRAVTLTDITATVSGAPFNLAVGATNTTAYTATIGITAADVTAGFIENSAQATGTAVSGNGTPLFGPGGEPIQATDTSDTGTDPQGDLITDPQSVNSPDAAGVDDGDPTNDPTVFDILVAPVAQDDNVAGVAPGTIAEFPLIVASNDTDLDGTVQVDRVSFVPPQGATTVLDADGDITTVTVPGEGTWTYNDVNGTATFTPEVGFEGDPTPIGYTVLDNDGLISNVALLTADYDQLPEIVLFKTVDDSALSIPPVIGEIVTYTYTVTNTGNISIQNVTVSETTFSGTGILPIPGAEVISSNTSGLSVDAAPNASIDNLGVGDLATFTADYAITQADLNSGLINNQATATGDNVTGTPVSDLSDDPNNPTTPDQDPTTLSFGQNASLEVVKSASAALSSPPAVGDLVTFDFEVTNTGNVTVFNIAVTETDFSGADPLAAPVFVNGGSDEDSGLGSQDLLPGETMTFRATYQIAAPDIAAGVLENSAEATGTDPNNDPVSDVSDSGTQPNGDSVVNPGVTETLDADGNVDGDPTNDPTVFSIETPPVAVADVVSDVTPGEPAVLLDIVGVNDTDVDGTPQPDRVSLVAPTGATTVTDADGDVISVTVPDEGTWTYDDATGAATFTPLEGFEADPTPLAYTVLDDDGLRSNAATLTAQYVREPSISVTKEADVSGLSSPPLAGEQITYIYTVTNAGNVRLFDVTVIEDAADFTGTGTMPAPALTSGGTDLNSNGNEADMEVGANTLTFTAIYSLTQEDIDTGEVINQAVAAGDNITGTLVSDVSDDPTDSTDAANNGDPADPTLVTLQSVPQLSLVKSVAAVPDTNGDGLFGGEDDTIFYSFLVVNTGNVTLTDIAIEDPLFDVLPLGTTITLAPGEGDNTTFTGEHVVTAQNVADGFVDNQATATGMAPDGMILTDLSDAGTDPDAQIILDPTSLETGDENGAVDGDPTNDPTIQRIPANPEPRLQVTKSVSAVRDENTNGLIDAGDVVVFVFTVANTGNVDLADIQLTDASADVTGTLASLAVLETDTGTFTAEYTVQSEDVLTGTIENSASATGRAVNSLGNPITDPDTGDALLATDVSDAGTEPDLANGGTPVAANTPEVNETPDADGNTDGDPRNDPTILNIPSPQISLVKSVADVPDTNGDGLFGGPGDIITYAFTVTNTGNVDFGDVMVNDTTAVVSGGPIDLAAGATDSITFSATYVVTNSDIAEGFVENTADVAAIGLDNAGAPLLGLGGIPITVQDVSDTGTDQSAAPIGNPEGVETANGNAITDGDPANDPTVTRVPVNPTAAISLIKTAVGSEDTNGDAVEGGFDDLLTYTFAVTNTGNFPLANIDVTDPRLGGSVGTIASLSVGETQTITATYLITFADFSAGAVENSAQASGTLVNSLGNPILDPNTGAPILASDTSDTGNAPDLSLIGNSEGVETGDLTGITDGDPTNDPTVTNLPIVPSGASISGVFFQDGNGNGEFDTGIDTLLAGIIVNLLDSQGRIVGTAVTDANGFYEIAGFPVGTDFSIEFRETATSEVLGTIGGLNFEADTVLSDQNGSVEELQPANLVLTKTASRDTVILGETVPYTISITNNGVGPAENVTVSDTLPAGMGFVPGTARLDGQEIATTEISNVTEVEILSVEGRTQSITGLTVAPGETRVITLSATVLPNASFGELTNVARAIDPATGEILASDTATVEQLPEAVFDCSDVIGKVFDDRNFNGYQDGITDNRAAVTNQNIFTDKLGKASPVPPSPQGEPGLPNVRLVTATGTIITTDEFGRYSVPCAELAGQYGTNFTLKIDTNSLPTGYRVTTENPRTMRLTAGIATEMNFGASIGRVLDIDLTSDAFNGTVPIPALEAGVAQLLNQIASTPSVIRISYFTRGETTSEARARINVVEDMINRRWTDTGRYKLIIETAIKRLQ